MKITNWRRVIINLQIMSPVYIAYNQWRRSFRDHGDGPHPKFNMDEPVLIAKAVGSQTTLGTIEKT